MTGAPNTPSFGRTLAPHSGAWGLANLELCRAALASSQGGREVLLHGQIPVPNRS